MPHATRTATDEALIRELIAEQHQAITAKDIDRLMGFYAEDLVAFDMKPPLVITGAEAWRAMWEKCLPYFPNGCGFETRDLHVDVSGDLAVAHWLGRFTGFPEGHPGGQMTLRLTASYRRIAGDWRVTHEHCSVPWMPQGC